MADRVPKVHPYNRGTDRDPNWWVRYTVEVLGQARGELIREPAGKDVRTKKAAGQFALSLERQFRLGTWIHPKKRVARKNRFADYAPKVIAARAARGVLTAAKDESGHVHHHLIPMFGDTELGDLTFKVIRDKFKALSEDKGLAGRTIRNIHTTLRAVLLEALDEGLIENVPQPLTVSRGHRPPAADKDPSWRETAVFSRDELAILLRCEDVHPQIRVMIAAYFMAGSRRKELLSIPRRDYDRGRLPLASLIVPASKVKRAQGPRVRVVPVHPDLKAWLDWWLDFGFELVHGTRPTTDSPLWPSLSFPGRARGPAMGGDELAYQWRKSLAAAGLRHRRLHDSRRTFLSVARSSGVDDKAARAITHTTTGDRILDAYTTWEWEALCKAIAAIEWRAPAPPNAPPASSPSAPKHRSTPPVHEPPAPSAEP